MIPGTWPVLAKCLVRGPGLLLAGFGLIAGLDPVFAEPAPAAEPSLSELVQKIQAAYEQTTDWKAEFQQVTFIEGFDSPIKSRGTLYIKKPGKLQWDYSEPNQHQILVNGGKIWIFTPEQKQVIITPFEEVSDSQLPLHLLSGIGRLDRDFDIQLSHPDTPPSNAQPVLTLIPKDQGAGLARLVIELDPASYFITGLTLYEVNGNRSQFRFLGIKNNSGLKDRLFEFKLPKDVVVVDSPRFKP